MHMPHMKMPHFTRRARAASAEEHHHHPAYENYRRVENGIDVFTIALVVLFALAMVYGLLTATGHPAYFDRTWGPF